MLAIKPTTISIIEGKILVPNLPLISRRVHGILIDKNIILLASFKELIIKR